MPDFLLRTDRLDLIAATLAHTEAELQSPHALGSLLRVSVPEGWPPGEYDRDALEYFHTQLRSNDPSHVGWYSGYALTRNSEGRRHALIGAAGYLGPPSGGIVAVGYSVVPSARGQGYATEIVTALVVHAFESPLVNAVLATTSDSNVPSTRVLLRCGFQRVGPGAEPACVLYPVERAPRA